MRRFGKPRRKVRENTAGWGETYEGVYEKYNDWQQASRDIHGDLYDSVSGDGSVRVGH